MKYELLLRAALDKMGHSGAFEPTFKGGGDTAVSGEMVVNGAFLFFKIHENAEILQSEVLALEALSAHVRVPRVLSSVQVEHAGVLILEHLTLRAPQSSQDWQAVALALARLHQPAGEGYGRFADNYIGGSIQRNHSDDSWQRFFAECRLQPQLDRAIALPAAVRRDVDKVIARLADWLPDRPASALLHGDLWSGNFALRGDTPVFYDPACYYGDPQVDLAMMALFGNTPESFYLTYMGATPDADLRCRWWVYDLYHLLNHFNLFGSSYAASIARVAAKLLRS